MSNTGRFRDHLPTMRPAGKVTSLAGETARAVLAPVDTQRPETPPNQRRYKQAQLLEPGAATRHFGTANDAIPVPADTRFGAKSKSSGDKAEHVINPAAPTAFDKYQREISERIYKTTAREQLGKGYNHGHTLPAKYQDEQFRFGSTGSTSVSAKELLFPEDRPEEDDAVAREMYKRTHNSYDPGEQKRLNYDWSRTQVADPYEHRFGHVKPGGESDGVKKCLSPAYAAPESSQMVPRREQEMRLASTHALGKGKILGTGDPRLPPDFTYGKPSQLTIMQAKGQREPGASEVIFGMFTEEQQAPDASLGKCTKPGLRNITTDPSRVFGVPSIRNDVAPPRIRSVANTQSYGNEAGARALLRPSPYSHIGVYDDDFLTALPRDELRDILLQSGFDMTEEEFEQSYEKAAASHPEGKVSIDSFRKSFQDLLLAS
eukprot:TRINITY_DN6101_c0_g1_i1.p1 TRINITY_DN6101_c0_g1~~TRINITY_DN6101_c0_g1_i1.p1  ORF type:complete len:432 (+),score=90.04 TRINITY_DN6101_c0_g1_i1:66-1361(+)